MIEMHTSKWNVFGNDSDYGRASLPPVHNNVLITPQSTCRMQVSSAGAELPSNVLRRGAISGALERYKELKHPTGHNVSEHRHESFHLVSHLARLLCFRERELERFVITA
ncbi:hypothetical protein M6B38_341315 [Iris pallida]|uniref:Uncharacterized protein n=1 Tax=Iris pallida TaxID=29817 RepID=A0AAX6GY88_IRIPA|nr:hypothetical protein M6B38_341315 [Iris pallida]